MSASPRSRPTSGSGFSLETERLLLRELTFDDLEALASHFADAEAMRYYPGTRNRAQTRDWIRRNLESYDDRDYGLWAVVLRSSGEVVGQCGLLLQEVDRVNEVEVGYHVHRAHWNQGIATEAATACRDYGFDRLGIGRLISIINPYNGASRRVAEKIGMTRAKETLWKNQAVVIYSVDRAARVGNRPE